VKITRIMKLPNFIRNRKFMANDKPALL
jgi:hypothetical protein